MAARRALAAPLHHDGSMRSDYAPPIPALLVAARPLPTEYANVVASHAVNLVHSAPAALIHLRGANPPGLVIADTGLPEGVDQICRTAAVHAPHTAVLVTTEHLGDVPPVLRAGCHAVLVRPFSPNLLHARVARLFRSGTGTDAPFVPTNRVCWYERCPACDKPDAVRFDAVSLRRWWFACLKCDHTWSAVDDDADRLTRRRSVSVSRASSAWAASELSPA